MTLQKTCYLNLEAGFEFGDIECPYDRRLHQIHRILKIDQKEFPYYSEGFLEKLDVSKIFAIVPSPIVKFNWELNGDVPEPVCATVLALFSNFLQKQHPDTSKIVLPKFGGRSKRTFFDLFSQ